MTQITGGSTRFMRRVQVAQYEPKEAEVTLTFAVSDGDDYHHIAATAGAEALTLTECMLAGKFAPQAAKEAVAQSAPVEHKPTSHKKTTKTEPVKEAAKADPSAVEDLSAMEAEVNAEVNAAAADPSAMTEETVVQEIPDKTLVDACSAASKLTQNSDVIRAIISGYVAPPGRVANIPQDKRAEFLLKLQTVPKLTNG
jgi:hypothetical protein